MKKPDEMNVTLAVPEWDFIMDKIMDRPYKEVAGLVAKMMNQFAVQRQPQPVEAVVQEEKKDAQPSN